MARAGAALFVGEGLVALVATVASGSTGWRAGVVAAVAVCAFAVAGVVLFAHSRLARWQTHLIAGAGAMLIGIVVGVERPIYGLLYVWLALFVASLFRPRAVVVHLAWILVCDAVAVTISDPVGRPLEAWILLAGILSGASAFVSFIRTYLTNLADRERQARTILDTLFSRAPVGLALFDRDLRYVRVNAVLAGWSGRAATDHIGLTVDEVHPGMGAQIEPAMRRILDTGEPELGIIARTRGRIYQSSRYPVSDESGTVTMIASIVDDVTELVNARDRLDEQNRLLASQARTDPLTRVMSRRGFDEALAAAIDAAEATTTNVALVYLDLDGLKQVNDDFGHAEGDRLLVAFAERLTMLVRQGDIVARLGGDEFAVVMSSLPSAAVPAAAQGLAKRIHRSLNEPVNLAAVSVRARTSIGVAHYPGDARTPGELLKAADAAMYDAKRQGPGNTSHANGSGSNPRHLRAVQPRRTA